MAGKIALLRIWDILKQYSDYDHPLTQAEIAEKLKNEYGISIERKAISRDLDTLRDAGVEIESRRDGSYIVSREFQDSELRMLIDGVLSSKHISALDSKSLIERLCGLSNVHFKSHVKNVYSVNDWGKTDNRALFLNIELADEAIEKRVVVGYEYNKYGADKKLHYSSYQRVSPYQMILHNQRYYLMGYSSYWNSMVFHRLDHMTNMKVLDDLPAVDIRKVKGYERGIDYKVLSSTMPYLFPEAPESVTFLANSGIIDQIIDWFGRDVRITKKDPDTVEVRLSVSPEAFAIWAVQYVEHVEVVSPKSLREKVKKMLEDGLKKYQ